MSASINNTSSWDNCSFVKKSAIVLAAGAAAGAFSYYASTYIAQKCITTESELGNYLCLRSSTFFEPENLRKWVNPMIHLANGITRVIQPLTLIIPTISLKPSNCVQLGNSLFKLIKDNTLGNGEAIAKIIGERVYEPCCTRSSTVNQALARSLGEEILFRFVLQGLVFIGLQKLPTLFKRRGRAQRPQNSSLNSVMKIVCHPYSRNFIISMIFAFSHYRSKVIDDQVLPNFISSFIHGAVFEKYGLFYGTIASTTSHFVNNLFSYRVFKNWCENEIAENLLVLKSVL